MTRMMDTKLTTVIVNNTKQGLTMKVGNRHCYARLTSVKVGGEYRMQIDVNWTYQEFLVQDKSDTANQLFLNSDDCCDYERITIKDKADGKLEVQTLLREQFRCSAPCSSILEEEEEEDRVGAAYPKLVIAMSNWNPKVWLSKFL